MKRLLLLSLVCCFLAGPPCPAQDALPKFALKRFGTTRLRHGSPIQCLAFAADGKLLAAGGSGDFIRLWNVETGTLRRSLPQLWATALAFSPQNGQLAAASSFTRIHIWDPNSGNEIAALPGHVSAVRCLAYSADGSLLASGGQDGAVLLWRPNMPNPLKQFLGHTDEVTALAFSPDGNVLASASTDRSIRLWSINNKEAKLPTIDAGCGVTGLVFSGDGKLLISAGDDSLLRLWDAQTGQPQGTLKGHEDAVATLLSQGGKTLVSGGRDNSIRLWDLAAKKPGLVVQRSGADSDALAISGDGKLLAYAGQNNTVHLVDIASNVEAKERLTEPGAAAAPVIGLAPSRNGKTLIALAADRTMQQWQVPTGKILATHRLGPMGDLTAALALTGLLDAGGMIKRYETIKSTDEILSMAAASDGRAFALGHRSGMVTLERHLNDKVVGLTLKYPGVPHVLAFATDGKSLAVSGNSKVVIFDVASGKKIQAFTTTDGPAAKQPRVASLAFAPGGRLLAVGCYDGVARLFDVKTGKQSTFFQGHFGAVLGLAFSPDGRVLATGSFDRTVRLWEVFNGALQHVQYENDVGLIASYEGHVGAVQAVCFALDGRSFFSGSSDTTVLHWDATKRLTDGVLAAQPLSDADLDDAWTKLATLDAARGQEVVWKMVAGAKQSLPYLEGKLPLVDGKQIDQYFTDLNDDVFAVRSKASEELLNLCKKHGMWMKSRLDEAVRQPKSEEGRTRAEQLLDRLLSMPSALSLAQERVRLYRCLQVLEQSSSPAAQDMLEKLSRSAPERPLQIEAQFALERLKKRAAGN